MSCCVTAGERIWQMPIEKSYAKEIRSLIADLKNYPSRAFAARKCHVLLSMYSEGRCNSKGRCKLTRGSPQKQRRASVHSSFIGCLAKTQCGARSITADTIPKQSVSDKTT